MIICPCSDKDRMKLKGVLTRRRKDAKEKRVRGASGPGEAYASIRLPAVAVPRQQRGVALIAALFLLVALAALGVYMVTLSGVQQDTPTRAADASRAWYIARSGMEAAAYEAVNGGCAAVNTSRTLDGFAVNITCSESTHTERGDTFQVFQLSATASRGSYGDRNYVARQADGTVSNAP